MFLLALTILYINGPQSQKYLSVSLIVAATLCINNAIFDNKFGRFLCLLGSISYSTYLVHTIILVLLVNGFGDKPSAITEFIVIPLYIGMVYVCSVLSYKKLEIGSFNSYIKNYLYKLCKV